MNVFEAIYGNVIARQVESIENWTRTRKKKWRDRSHAINSRNLSFPFHYFSLFFIVYLLSKKGNVEKMEGR